MTSVVRRVFPWFRVVVLAGLLAAEGWVLWRWGVATLGQWLSLVGGGGITAACVVWVGKGIREWQSGVNPAEAARLDRAAADLATAVQRTWMKEAAHRGLTSPLPIAVRLRPADPRITAHPSQWAGPSQAVAVGDAPEDVAQVLTGTAGDIADLYNRVTTGRLVIVGAPGGGKTGAAVLLLLALCDTPRTDGRIPVWFLLASWDPRTTPIEQCCPSSLTTCPSSALAPSAGGASRAAFPDGNCAPRPDFCTGFWVYRWGSWLGPRTYWR
jgi:hypothetical protein